MHRPVIAFGPAMPGWGSWHWVGADLARQLAGRYCAVGFEGADVPACDAVVVVKHALPADVVRRLAARAAVVYFPVDYYGSAGHIHGDRAMLGACARVLVHCRDLLPLFAPHCRVEYMDHHLKYAAPLRESYVADGPLVWVGVRTNVPALADWVNRHPLPGELRVLTNLEDPKAVPRPRDLGFNGNTPVVVEDWGPRRHLELTRTARAALDVKGDDFRSRHKPPAKAIDFIASGVPLAMNPDSSPARHLAGLGLRMPSPLETSRWLSRSYWEETCRFGRLFREELTLQRIGQRFARLLDAVLAERQDRTSPARAQHV